MESRSKEVEELPTRSTEKSFEQLLDEEEEEEDVFDETFMGSIIDLIYQTWITNTFQNDGISQYMTKLEHGQLYTVSTPEGQTGHQLIRVDLCDIHDIKNKEKRQWWKYAKMRTQFVTSSPRDRKQQVVNRLLDWVADDLRKVPSLMKEKKNVL
ncbi:hypothetical protein G5I_01188 [Acromyrmex echinatior]|uniref:Uncharacterized protein n=1 Tax=Acromyrmex echinatior TaxID=103372 RepID=F4W6Y1_ACREC|nr:hypothetical protein G5I_01188 [Acromyrmex echinatior]